MDATILSSEIQKFINSNINSDLSKLAFSKNPFPEVDWPLILSQISAKANVRTKLPLWFNTASIYYPPRISIEQTSSEITAKYKSQIVSGESLIDLSGGFGVDDYYFSTKINDVTHCEINPELSAIAAYNFTQLKAFNVNCLTGESLQILAKSEMKFDWIYIDPSRRNDLKGKVFMMKDCLPDVPGNLDFYFSKADHILIKTSPLLDLSAGIAELGNVKSIHVIAVRNEVKELLWVLNKDYNGKIELIAVNLGIERAEHFKFLLGDSRPATFGLPKKFLFEPNAAIMKSGGFDQISAEFAIDKLHPHSHLYTSESLMEFPGRIFKIEEVIAYNKSAKKKLMEIKKANITVRNFPETVESIRKKFGITDGGSLFCFFTTDMNNDKIAVICTKIK